VSNWFNIETWGKLAETYQQYLSKGRLVFIADRYEQDGETQ